MVILAVEITNLGPVERAHGRERGAIVAVYVGKGQGMGQAGFLFKGASRSSEPCLRLDLADVGGRNWTGGKPIPLLCTLFGCCQATQQRHQHQCKTGHGRSYVADAGDACSLDRQTADNCSYTYSGVGRRNVGRPSQGLGVAHGVHHPHLTDRIQRCVGDAPERERDADK